MYKKEDIERILECRDIWFKVDEHPAVYDMAALESIRLSYPEAEAKNLFLRDDKKNYYLLVIKGEGRVNLKEVRKSLSLRPLSFAGEEELMEYLSLTPGSVTPFGLLNDTDKKVICYIDSTFLLPPGIIGIHPNDNTATVVLKTDDLINILRENGSDVRVVSFEGEKL